MKDISFIWKRWPKTAADVVHTPSFSLRVIKLPKDAQTFRKHMNQSQYPSLSDYHLDNALDKLKTDRNMHVLIPWDSKINFRRNKTINRLKRAACLTDYRDIYWTGKDLVYVYTLKTGILFTTGYQLTILNLFALRYINHLKMSDEEGNRIINNLINSYTHTDIQENRLKEVMPYNLSSESCMQKFEQMLAKRKSDLVQYDDKWNIKLAILNTDFTQICA